MIRKLQKKFILAAMLSVFIVLFLIIGVINIRSYIGVIRRADETLAFMKDNGGAFPDKNGEDEAPPKPEESGTDVGAEISDSDKRGKNDGRIPAGMSPETPFESRYFTVNLDGNGDVISVDTEKIAAVGSEDAETYARQLYTKNKTHGLVDGYRYTLLTNDGGYTYIFLDISRDLGTFSEFLKTSIIISAIGMVIVFILVTFMSSIVVRPVAQAYKKQKQFITDASHELKTPMAVIAASCEVLDITYGKNEWTDSIKSQVTRLTDLTNKLVLLSKADEENAHVVMTEFSLTEIAEKTVKPYATLAKTKGKHLYINIDGNISIKGDVSLIKELFVILLDNAVKYSSAGSDINLSVAKSGKNCKIILSNTTDGVPEGNLDMLFERFYRLDMSRNSKTGGHGIGLSAAKAITELHHGKISACSADGKKIVFTVVL